MFMGRVLSVTFLAPMKRGLKDLIISIITYEVWDNSYIPCPDEKGTESPIILR